MRRFRQNVYWFAAWIGLSMTTTSSAQIVQLPTFHHFHYSGSVLVPDRGTASLGGVSRSSSARTARRGSGVARGGGVSHAGASAHVTIIDHDAIDRRLRGLPPKSGTAGHRPWGPNPQGQATGQVRADDQARRNRNAVDPNAEGKALVRYARRQYNAGKHASAFDAYRLAISALSEDLAALAEAEFRRAFPSGKRPLNHAAQRFTAEPSAD